MRHVFEVVRRGRDAGVEFLQQRRAAGDPPEGWEIDEVRNYCTGADQSNALSSSGLD